MEALLPNFYFQTLLACGNYERSMQMKRSRDFIAHLCFSKCSMNKLLKINESCKNPVSLDLKNTVRRISG